MTATISFRRILFLTLSLLSLAVLIAAEPQPGAIPGGVVRRRKGGPERLNAATESTQQEGKNTPIAGADSSINYLITLTRSVTNVEKDDLFDFLMAKGAVVKQVYDYRVYKGVLFSIPSISDLGLNAWTTYLAKLDGVKFVEEDQIVKTQ